jgi:hypothetical protein
MANIQSLPVHCDEISEPLMSQFVGDYLTHSFFVGNRRFLFIVQQRSFSVKLPKIEMNIIMFSKCQRIVLI